MPKNEKEKDDVIFDDIEQEEAPDMTGVTLVSSTDGSEERSEESIHADIKQIEALSKIDPSIKEMDEYKNLVDLANEHDDEEFEDEDDEEYEDEDDEEYEDDEEIEDEDEYDDPFGITKTMNEDEVVFEISDDVADFIEDHYAINSVDTFFDSVDKWRNQAQESTQITVDHEDLLDGLQSLPQEIKDAITAYANADDYHAAFGASGERLNFDINFSTQKKEKCRSALF